MKQQIHAYKGHGEIAIEGHNLKLGRGGIREIEFFVQTQQLIAGGRHPQLRGREHARDADGAGRRRLDQRGSVRRHGGGLRFLRNAEHRLQMVADEQTQTLPAEREGIERFARFLGFDGRDDFAPCWRTSAQSATPLSATVRSRAGQKRRGARLRFSEDQDDPATLDNLSAMGFPKPLQISASVRRWLSGGYRALKSEAARQHLAALMPSLLRHLAKSENPETVFAAFDHFLTELHAGGAAVVSIAAEPRSARLLSR